MKRPICPEELQDLIELYSCIEDGILLASIEDPEVDLDRGVYGDYEGICEGLTTMYFCRDILDCGGDMSEYRMNELDRLETHSTYLLLKYSHYCVDLMPTDVNPPSVQV